MVDRPIKVERDEDDNSDTDVPCVSTVPIPADKNTGSYYYPSQAMVSPRTPAYTTIGKMAQKRKTVQALAHAALMTADEPILFEETIWCNNAKIVLIDTKTRQVIARDHLRKDNSTTATPASQTTDSTTTASSGISKTHPHRHKTGSTTTHPATGETSFSSAITSPHSTSSVNTPAFPATTTKTASISSAVTSTLLPARSTQSQPARLEIPATATASRPRTSLLNSLPSERAHAQSAKNLSEKPPTKQTTYKPLAVAPSASIRPETNSKLAVCLPNKASKPESSLVRAVYVPREINLGVTELRLEDCINVKDICDKELTKWTAEDVAKFVRATDCAEYAHVFVDQEIDGKALTLLNQDFLIQWMKLKLGPAMKLNCHIINLKHSLNNS